MDNRKVFIGISLDEKTKKFINQKIQSINNFPANFVAPENYHLTLKYLGFTSDEEIHQICQRLKKKISQVETFDVYFTQFGWGPTDKNPRMIWLKGERSDELINIQRLIEEAVFDQDQLSQRPFLPHITIARIRKKDFQRLGKENFSFPSVKVLVPASSVEIFESKKEGRKRKYYVLESIVLK